MSTQSLPSLGPYTWVSADTTRGRYRLAVYGAFNAFGLIGSEHNGIVVLDNVDMCVVADRLFQQDSGYFGPSASQMKALQTMLTCSPREFCNIVNSSGRNRHTIHTDSVAPAAAAFNLV